MRALLILPLALVLTGCEPRLYYRRESHLVTDAQRQAAAEFEQKAIADLRVSSVSGHDQDWDDVMAQIHKQAVELYGTEFVVERHDYNYTGRRWPIDQFNEAQARSTYQK